MGTGCASPVCKPGRGARCYLKERKAGLCCNLYSALDNALDCILNPRGFKTGQAINSLGHCTMRRKHPVRMLPAQFSKKPPMSAAMLPFLGTSYGRKPLTTIELGVTSSDEAAAMMPAIAPPIPARIKAANAPLLKPSALVAAERRAHFGAVP
jgi:hypothetical protein